MRNNTERNVFRIFLGILIFSPLAFGAVETWSLLIMEAGIFTALLLFSSSARQQGEYGYFKAPGMAPLTALLCYMLIQVVPFPPALIGKISPATFELYTRSVWLAEPGTWATFSLYPKGTVSQFLRLSSYAGAYLLATQLLSDSDRLKKTVHLLSIFAAALAFLSIMQHLVPNGKIYWIRELTQGGIPFGPYVNRNHFAGLMGMLLPIVMVLFLLSRPSSPEVSFRKRLSDILDRSLRNIHLLLGCSAILVALSIFLSLSRGGILSLCVSVALLGFLLSRRVGTPKGRLLLAATVIIILYAVGWFGWTPIFERFRSIRTLQGDISELRLDIWKDSLGMIRDFPLTGTGAGSFMHVYPAYRTIRSGGIADHAHNDHLELLTDGGIIGAGLFAWFIAAVLKHSYQAFLTRKDPYARHLFAGSLAGISAFLLHGLTDFNFSVGANGLYLFLLLGLMVSAVHFRSAGQKQSRSFTAGHSLRKVIVWCSGGLLLMSALLNSGQMLGSMLGTEISRISLGNASPELLAYYRDTSDRASFLDPLEPSHHYRLCRAAEAISGSLRGNQGCLNAVRLSPSNAEYLQGLGSAMEKAGNTAAADTLFAWSIARARTDASVIRHYGRYLLGRGIKEDALRQFRIALSLEPDKIRDYITLLVLEGMSDTEILGIIPEDPESRIAFAEYLDATGSRGRGLYLYEEAAALLRKTRPESLGIYWRIAQFAAGKSRFAEALAAVELAAERYPEDIGISLAIADYHEKMGQKEQAAAAYRKVLSLDAENTTALHRLKEIAGGVSTNRKPD